MNVNIVSKVLIFVNILYEILYFAYLALQEEAHNDENRLSLITEDVQMSHGSPNSLQNETVQMPPGCENDVILDVIKQEPMPIHRPYRAHARALSNIIDMPRNDLDDVTFIEDSPGAIQMPLPIACTSTGLVKYENEVVSGDKPFAKTVSIKT